MNTALFCLAVLTSAPVPGPEYRPVYQMTAGFESVSSPTNRFFQTSPSFPIFRGQTPGYDEVPRPNTAGQPQTFAGPKAVPAGPMITPGCPSGCGTGDPFLTGQPGVVPGGAYGVNGPQPHQLYRWVSRYDFGYLPEEDASRGLGGLEVFEFDAEWQYSFPVFWNWIFSFTQEFGLRTWEGPQTNARFPATSLPGSVYRFGWDLKLETPANYAWGALVAFNPSFNTDFGQNLSSDAWNWDGRGMIFYRPTPQWTLVGGAGFWDRVNDRVIPYAGVIFRPDDRWEFNIVLPEPRISYFLGQPWGINTWIYARGEYHVEAYEIELERSTTRDKDKVELSDWRLLLGLRWDTGWVTAFWEAGWVFGRNVDYLRSVANGFDVETGFITRAGIRY